MRRNLCLLYLFPIALLTMFAFGGYVEVEDTISLQWPASVFDGLLFWVACSGIGLLFLGLLLRFYAARPVIGLTLSTCIGFTLHSLVTYPANFDDAHAAPALSRSQFELYALLVINVLLLILAIAEPRIRTSLVTKGLCDR